MASSTADVFLRLRVSPDQVKRDVDEGLSGVDTRKAGAKAGGDFSNSFGNELKKRGSGHGSNFVNEVAKGITLRRAVIATAVTAGLATLPALFAAGGIGAGLALGGALILGLAKTNPKVKSAASSLAKSFTSTLNKASDSTGFTAKLVAGLNELRTRALPNLQRVFSAVFRALGPLIKPATDALITFSGWLANHANAGISHFLTFVRNLKQPVANFIQQLKDHVWPNIARMLSQMAGGAGSSVRAFGNLLVAVSPLLPALGTLARIAATMLAKYPALIPVLAGVAGGIKALSVISSVAKAFGAVKTMTSIVKGFGLASKLSLLANPWVLLAAAVVAATILIIKYWKPISKFFAGVWSAIYNGFIKPVFHWFHDNWLVFAGLPGIIIKYWGPISRFFVGVWHGIYNGFIAPLINFFTKSVPHAFDVAWGHVKGWAADVKNAFVGMWSWVYNHVWTPVYRFFTATLPSWFHTAIGFVNSHFVAPFRNAISGAWTWVYDHVFSPIYKFFTSTLPGWFSTAVTKVGQFWTKVTGIVQSPIKWVFQHVFDPLASGFDTVTNALGLGKPIPAHVIKGWASGTPAGGASPGWAWVGERGPELVRFHGGEHVLDHARSMATGLRIPGYASGTNPPRQVLSPLSQTPAEAKARQQAVHAAKTTPKNNPLGGIIHAVGGIIGKVGDLGKIAAAIATGNATALVNGIAALLGNPSVSGAAGEMLKIVTAIPKKLLGYVGDWISAHLLGSGGGSGPGSGPLGGATGSEMQNGRQLYAYLLKNVFGGAKIAAAGATASIWGESTWNPFAQGTGGRGLIGWTPPGTISDAAFRGGMRTQLPAIIRFISTSGDWGVIQRMKSASSVSQAAWLWGRGVERFGIPDVHPTGIALATPIMNGGGSATSRLTAATKGLAWGGNITEPVYGVGLRTGQGWMLGEQGNERVVARGDDPLLTEIMRLRQVMERNAAQTAAGVAMAIKAPRGQESQAARNGAR